MKLATLVIAGLALGWPAAEAEACKFAMPAPYQPSPLAHDVVAPSMPVVEWNLREPKLPDYLPFACASIGRLVLKVTASDDQTATTELGYRIVIRERGRGLMMRLGVEPVQPGRDGTFVIPYQNELDLEIDIRAVDRNGNAGPTTTITIDTVTRQAHLELAKLALRGVVLLPLLIVAIRRRRQRVRSA